MSGFPHPVGYTGTPAAPFDVADAYKWVLYVNANVHENEVRIVKNADLENFILIQDVRHAREELPDWLGPLPVLVDTHARLAYRGRSCFTKLVGLELPPEHLRRLSKAVARRNKWHE
jgi:hypothetical protein